MTSDVPPAPTPQAPAPTRRSRLARASLGLALVAAAVAGLSGFGTRLRVWGYETGLSMLALAVLGEALAAVLAGVALALLRRGRRPGALPAVAALVVALPVVVLAGTWKVRAAAAPVLHDVSTDTANPPRFVAILPLRADAPNPATYGGPEIAALQREAWPELGPRLVELPPERAFQRALDVARASGWTIVAADPAALRIEATDRTFWFGFTDDVVVRLTPAGARTVVDVRSVSRVGRGDVGTNARRILDFLDALDA